MASLAVEIQQVPDRCAYGTAPVSVEFQLHQDVQLPELAWGDTYQNPLLQVLRPDSAVFVKLVQGFVEIVSGDLFQGCHGHRVQFLAAEMTV